MIMSLESIMHHAGTPGDASEELAAIACEQCHRNFRTEPPSTAPTECIACHASDWQRTASLPVPDHTSGGAAFTVPNCQRCHLNVTPPNTWDGAFVVPP